MQAIVKRVQDSVAKCDEFFQDGEVRLNNSTRHDTTRDNKENGKQIQSSQYFRLTACLFVPFVPLCLVTLLLFATA
jgi:hypothetical protein